MSKTREMQKAIEVADDACNNTRTKIQVLQDIYEKANGTEAKAKALKDWADACRKMKGEHTTLMEKIQLLHKRCNEKKGIKEEAKRKIKHTTIQAAEQFVVDATKVAHTYAVYVSLPDHLK